MFSSSSKIRPAQLPNQTQRSFSPFSVTNHHSSNYLDTHQNFQIETAHSVLDHPLKISGLCDNSYNQMIYQWRKRETASIVAVVQTNEKNFGKVLMKNSNANNFIQNVVKIEPILYHINSVTLNKQQMLYVFKCMIDGHQAIFRRMKATNVCLSKTVVNFDGEVKVWVNQCFESNDICGVALNRQDLIIQKIFENICILSNLNSSRLRDFIDYVKISMNRNGKWSFSYLRGLIHSYLNCMKLNIVTKIITQPQSETKNLKHSLVSNTSRRKSTLQNSKTNNISPHNGGSERKWNEINRQKSQNSKESQRTTKLNSFKSLITSEIPASKKTNEEQALQNYLKRSKHSNSISGFQNILKDSIVEQGRPSLKMKWQSKKSLEKQHQKETKSSHFIFNKMGIPQALNESSQTATPYYLKTPERSPRLTVEEKKKSKLSIISQFGFALDKTEQKEDKPKQSLISTTNQTTLSGFVRKSKESHFASYNDQKQQLRTASKDRYEKMEVSAGNQKIISSYTHSSYPSNLKELGRLIKKFEQSNIIQTKEEQFQESLKSSTKLGLSNNNIPKKCIEKELSQLEYGNQLKEHKNQQVDVTDLKSLKMSQSYQNLADSIIVVKSQKSKIKHLSSMNKNLTFSTYIDSNSQKLIPQSSSKKLQQLQQTLDQLFQANEKQNEICQVNNWTKKIDNLVGIKVIEELKESINFDSKEQGKVGRGKNGKWREMVESIIEN